MVRLPHHTKCLNYLADIERYNYSIASHVLGHDFYVDDLLSGTDTIEEALVIRDQLISILQRGSFQLRKWASNEPSLLSELNNANDKHMIIEFHSHDKLKTLGIHWNAIRDTLGYKTAIRKIDTPTKRNILSMIASMFDPLGLIGAIVVRGKLIIQELWKTDVSWVS